MITDAYISKSLDTGRLELRISQILAGSNNGDHGAMLRPFAQEPRDFDGLAGFPALPVLEESRPLSRRARAN